MPPLMALIVVSVPPISGDTAVIRDDLRIAQGLFIDARNSKP